MRSTVVCLTAFALLGLTACTSDPDAPAADDAVITVTANETACQVSRTDSPAGTVTFRIANTGTKVTEFYLYAEGDRVMGEVENITPGLTRELTVGLPPGDYQTSCRPGMTGTGIRAAFSATGSAPPVNDDAKLTAATDSYHRYVISQSDALLTRTTEFAAAVKAGDTARAKALYPVSRTYFERIEPVASSFGDLDPKIDGRADVIAEGMAFTGYHRLERDLWTGRSLAADGPIADQLVADVTELVARVKGLELTPLQLANGAKSLLDEIATGKITGEEERYSYTDLWDFQANLEGSRAAIQALRPALQDRAPDLVVALDERFAVAQDTLAEHAVGDGWKLHPQLTQVELRELSDAVNALAEPVSKVAAAVAR
ncbi:iron uptake system component EfeO [Allocatelliglobosispora scoriae]|uniref:Iron uptake system component EfeO n=1 Tax=Allocatelliglobosispora scoriae TaxID=643052 RepID=A0A841C340_9ACTN|nr:iron uptake system component EfeO [Allocatelliglobosispora scoriae]